MPRYGVIDPASYGASFQRYARFMHALSTQPTWITGDGLVLGRIESSLKLTKLVSAFEAPLHPEVIPV